MIVINPNKVHINGVIIPEEVYVRTSQSCGVGNTIKRERVDENGNPVLDENGNPVYDEFIVYIISYTAWLKSKYEEVDSETNEQLKYNADPIYIDELDAEVYVEISKDKDMTSYPTLSDVYKLFNEEYMKVIEQKGVITSNDYTIV